MKIFWVKGFFLLLSISAGSVEILSAPKNLKKSVTTKKKIEKKKILVEIADPKILPLPNSPLVNDKTKETTNLSEIEMPLALVGGKANTLSPEELKFFDTPGLSDPELALLNSFIHSKNWSVLLSTLNLWLLVRHDLHEGERLRLELMKARTLGQQRRYAEAHELLKYYYRYLKITEKDLFRPEDRIRHKNLMAHWHFVAEDLNKLEQGSAL